MTVPVEIVKGKIYLIRGQKVLLDSDLAELYGVTTANLNKAVKRNIERFPVDFMFQLEVEEAGNLIFQSGISSSGHGGRRKLPFVFTEQGVAMLSSVLKSERAVQVRARRLFNLSVVIGWLGSRVKGQEIFQPLFNFGPHKFNPTPQTASPDATKNASPPALDPYPLQRSTAVHPARPA